MGPSYFDILYTIFWKLYYKMNDYIFNATPSTSVGVIVLWSNEILITSLDKQYFIKLISLFDLNIRLISLTRDIFLSRWPLLSSPRRTSPPTSHHSHPKCAVPALALLDKNIQNGPSASISPWDLSCITGRWGGVEYEDNLYSCCQHQMFSTVQSSLSVYGRHFSQPEQYFTEQ